MKQWFPFTDYDFYAYLTAGVMLIAAVDYGLFGGILIQKTDWPAVHIVFWVGTAYVVGQIVANPATLIVEQWLGRTVFHSPVSVLLGLSSQRLRERIIRDFLVGRIYAPLDPSLTKRILVFSALQTVSLKSGALQPEAIFNLGFPLARRTPDAAVRMDQFRNLYGFCRNTAFVAAIACILVLVRASKPSSSFNDYWIALASFLVSVGMFGRFIKFYSEFAAEMLRTFNAEILKNGHTK
jgi:hypothetical protein